MYGEIVPIQGASSEKSGNIAERNEKSLADGAFSFDFFRLLSLFAAITLSITRR